MEQARRDTGDLVDCGQKQAFVSLGWLGKSADLSNELKRGGADFFFRHRWFKVEESFDVSAHKLRSGSAGLGAVEKQGALASIAGNGCGALEFSAGFIPASEFEEEVATNAG